MSSPNTNNSYAGAVKKQKAKSSQRSSSNATSPVSKRKREDSSYSAERKNVNEAIEPPKNGKNDDEEESFLSVSDEIQYSAAGDRSAGKTEIEEDVTDLFLSASSVDTSADLFLSASGDKSAEDITHEKRSTGERKYVIIARCSTRSSSGRGRKSKFAELFAQSNCISAKFKDDQLIVRFDSKIDCENAYKLAQTRKINGKFHPKLEMKAEEAERSENQENSSFNTTKESRPHTNNGQAE